MGELAFKTRIVPKQIVCLCGSQFIRSVCYNCGNVLQDKSSYLLIPITIRESKPKIKKTSKLQKLRYKVFERDGWICLKCGFTPKSKRIKGKSLGKGCYKSKNMLTLDHVKPKAQGGKNTIENLQTLCLDCNGEKGATHVDYRKPNNDKETLENRISK